jgi:hypothetical protein
MGKWPLLTGEQIMATPTSTSTSTDDDDGDDDGDADDGDDDDEDDDDDGEEEDEPLAPWQRVRLGESGYRYLNQETMQALFYFSEDTKPEPLPE